MSIFSSKEDSKNFHEECITSEERKVKYYKKEIKERRKSIKEFEKRVRLNPDDYNRRWLKSERDLLKIEMRGLKQHMDFLSEWQKRYEQYYGLQFSHGKVRPLKRSVKQELTLILGGRPDAKIHSGILSETGRKFIAELSPEKV